MDCDLTGSSVHGISQASILVWVAISFSSRSSRLWDQTTSSALASECFVFFCFFFYHWATREAQKCVFVQLLGLCDPMNCSTPGFPVLHHLLEFAQIHIHWVSDAIQPSHPPSPTFNVSQHNGLFQWVGSLRQVAKVLKLQLQHQSFQWIFRVHFLSD